MADSAITAKYIEVRYRRASDLALHSGRLWTQRNESVRSHDFSLRGAH